MNNLRAEKERRLVIVSSDFMAEPVSVGD